VRSLDVLTVVFNFFVGFASWGYSCIFRQLANCCYGSCCYRSSLFKLFITNFRSDPMALHVLRICHTPEVFFVQQSCTVLLQFLPKVFFPFLLIMGAVFLNFTQFFFILAQFSVGTV